MTKVTPLVSNEDLGSNMNVYEASLEKNTSYDVTTRLSMTTAYGAGARNVRDIYEADRSALLREVEKGAQYLNTLLAMFDNDGCVYPAQSLESDLKNEIIAFLSSHPT